MASAEPTTLNVTEGHIVKTPGVCGGKARIDGHRIRVQDVYIWHEMMGMSADEIAHEYDLTLGQVHAALSYAFDHIEEIQADIHRADELVAELKKQTPSKLQAKLRGE